MKSNPTIEIKSFKPALGLSEETLAFTGRLYIDNKPVAELSNRGHGDPVDWRPVRTKATDEHPYGVEDPKAVKALEDLEGALAISPTARTKSGFDLDPSMDWFLAELAELTLQRQKEKRQVAGKSWVRLDGKDYGEDDWHVFRIKWTPENRARLEERHGPVVESLNDRVAARGPIQFKQALAQMGVDLEDLAKVRG